MSSSRSIRGAPTWPALALPLLLLACEQPALVVTVTNNATEQAGQSEIKACAGRCTAFSFGTCTEVNGAAFVGSPCDPSTFGMGQGGKAEIAVFLDDPTRPFFLNLNLKQSCSTYEGLAINLDLKDLPVPVEIAVELGCTCSRIKISGDTVVWDREPRCP